MARTIRNRRKRGYHSLITPLVMRDGELDVAHWYKRCDANHFVEGRIARAAAAKKAAKEEMEEAV